MKTFILYLSIFMVLAVASLSIKVSYYMKDDRYMSSSIASPVYAAIKKSREKLPASRILLLGDSVGKQFFRNNITSDTLISLVSNQAASLAGQYVLLVNFLAQNPAPGKVVMVYHPGSFSNNLDQKYTYNYFLKPYYREEYLSLYEDRLQDRVQSIPFYRFCQNPLLLTTDWSPAIRHGQPSEFSEISGIYLGKIIDMCEEYHIPFELKGVPVSENNRDRIDALGRAVSGTRFESCFTPYLDQFIFLGGGNFVDDTHMRDPDKYRAWVWQNVVTDNRQG